MAVVQTIKDLLGLGWEGKDLGLLQVSLRAIIVFVSALVMVRLADRRFLSKMTAFDAILGFVLGSMLARAINGSSPLVPTLVAGFILVALHRFLAALAYRKEQLEAVVKGRTDVLVKKGHQMTKTLRANHISDSDLLEEIRLNGRIGSLEEVEQATLERSGEISVIPKSNQ